MLSSANNAYYHLTGKLKFGILHIEMLYIGILASISIL